jgi:GT2 family glycosyltransferase
MRRVAAPRPALVLRADAVPGRFHAALPPGAAGSWCRLAVGTGAPGAWWAKLEARDAARDQVVREAFLGPVRRSRGIAWRSTLLHLPAFCDSLALQLFADGTPPQTLSATLRVLGRRRAALALLLGGWRHLPRALAGGWMGLPGRLRAVLGQAPARAGQAPGYDTWLRLYDAWGPSQRAALAGEGAALAVAVIGADRAARAATLAALGAQWTQPAHIGVADTPAGWSDDGAASWLLVLRAGEVPPAHALACFSHAAQRGPMAGGFFADTDRLVGGVRADPLFKPVSDPILLHSGLAAQGACLFRADLVRAGAGPAREGDAGAWRLALARALPPGGFRRIPLVLTHLPDAAPPDPRPVLRPARRAAGPAGSAPRVTIVIPSAARSPHVLRCLRRVLACTAYAGGFDVMLAVSRIDAGDRAQETVLARAAALARVSVLDLGMDTFNYAAVNNAAVAQARGELVLLLNDDVAPIRADWLSRMAALMSGPADLRAGIVGARLLYGNGLVQHGGVTMGLANLCEHSFRLCAHADAGPHGIAALDRQVSAVTGACLLVRRYLYAQIGGMDARFAIALNDVDFCLRAGQAGHRVVMAAGVVLHHYESLSLGRHYEGVRSGLEALEVRRLRDRWAAVIADDPFYSPNASRMPGREFQPGFPPGSTPDSWIRGASSVQAWEDTRAQLRLPDEKAIALTKG